MITVPTLFKAIPINEGMPMLLEHKAKEDREIEAKTKEVIKKYGANTQENTSEEGQFALVPGEKATFRKLFEMADRCQKSYDFIFYWKAALQIIDKIIIFLKELLRKEIDIRILVYMNEGERLHKEVLSLKRNGSFQARCTFTSPPITLSLFDNKETFFNIALFNPSETPSLWSNNPTLIVILQDYFEQKWRDAKKVS